MGYAVITKIITPVTDYSLLSLAEFKEDWQITTTGDDIFITRLLARASAAASQFCNRIFQEEELENTFLLEQDDQPGIFPGGPTVLQLSRWPITEVVSVTQGNGIELIEDEDFKVNPSNGQLFRLRTNGSTQSWEPLNVVVQFTGGYAAIPYDVQDAVSRMAYTRFAERKRDPLIKSQFIEGIERIEYIVDKDGGNLDPSVMDLLDNYRVPVTS